jgi:predicted metal-dependent phosphoesterase TrpH
MLKVDLHIHTADDPLDRLQHTGYDVIDRAAELGLDALAITLHETQLTDARLVEYARERGVTLIPGVERSIEGKHVLLLNFPAEAAERTTTFEDLRRAKGRCAGLVIAPHPFFPGPTCLGGLLDRHATLFDAVEFSYFHTRWANFNERAVGWARTHNKPLVGNSDLHDLRQLGRTFSEVAGKDRSADAICEAIRSGAVVVRSSPVPLVELGQVFGGMVLSGWRPPRRRIAAPASSLPGSPARHPDLTLS